jgi:hypothetical protein
MSLKYAWILCWMAGSTLACGGKSKEESFADSFCAEVLKCCAQADMVGGQGSLCRMSMAGGVTNIDGCLTEMQAELADGSFCTYLGNPPSATAASAACAAPSRQGNKKPGEDCFADSDCAPSSQGTVACASAYADGNFIDKCQVQIAGRAGDTPCLGTREGGMSVTVGQASEVPTQAIVCDTSDGVICERETCKALAAVGESCSSSFECVRTAFCDSSQGKCATKVTLGDSCLGKDDDECEGGYCAAQGSGRACAARVLNGAVCSEDGMCISDNCVDGTCKPSFLDAFGLAFLCG